MAADTPRIIASSWCGLTYGAALTALGMLAAGMGHGCYVPLGLASAPLGLVPNVLFVLVGTPLLWALAAALAGGSRRRSWRRAFLLLMVAHYISLFRILGGRSEFSDWSYLPRVREEAYLVFSIYGLGQIALLTLATSQTVKSFAQPPSVDGR